IVVIGRPVGGIVSSLGLGDPSTVLAPAKHEGARASPTMRASLMLAALTVTVVGVACRTPSGARGLPCCAGASSALPSSGAVSGPRSGLVDPGARARGSPHLAA